VKGLLGVFKNSGGGEDLEKELQVRIFEEIFGPNLDYENG
jgi:hypothetical protein